MESYPPQRNHYAFTEILYSDSTLCIFALIIMFWQRSLFQLIMCGLHLLQEVALQSLFSISNNAPLFSLSS